MNSEKLQNWALIAEIVSAIAVVLSLIYVGLELSENTRVLEATSRTELASQDIAYLSSALDSTILANAVSKRESGQELSQLEESQLMQREHLNFRIFENALYQRQVGALEERQWQRYEVIIEVLICNNRYVQQMWDRNRAFQPEFVQIVNNIRENC